MSDASSDAVPLGSLKCYGDSVPKSEASVSDASSDAVPLSELKFSANAVPKSEDSSSSIGDAKNDDKKFVSLSVKVEPEEHGNINYRVTTENEATKVKAENSAPEAETVRLKISTDALEGKQGMTQFTEKQEPTVKTIVNGTDSSDAVKTAHPSSNASTSDVLQPGLLPSSNEQEKVCSKTKTDSLIENDVSPITAVNVDNKQQSGVSNTDSAASNTTFETGSRPLGCEMNCDNNATFDDSEHGNEEHSIESTTDVTVTTHSKCCSSQKSKKLVSKQGKATSPNSPGL